MSLSALPWNKVFCILCHYIKLRPLSYILFSRRWDDTVRYSGIHTATARYRQLDTYEYSWIQWDTVDLLQKGIDIESIQGYTGCQGYGEIQAGYR